jgi:AcrR family transcriptional regulator
MAQDPRITRTRQRVLTAAWQLLTEVGFAEVTIDLISDRSGVARSTLYRHWNTKEEILRDAFTAAATNQATTSDAPHESTHAAFVRYVQSFADGVANLWGRAAVTLAVSAVDDPDQRVAQRTFTDGNRRDLSFLLARAQEDGHARATTNLDEFVEVTLAPVFYRYLFTDVPADASAAGRIAERAWDWLATERLSPKA